MTAPAPSRLFGRTGELEILGQLIANTRGGQSAVLVLRGESGIGKTELLRYLMAEATGFTVVRGVGVESEMELAFAGLHQLCAPMLGRLDSLAEPQRRALSVAFGLTSGDSPDRFMVALAVLSLMAETSEQRPLLCVVDDAQWLDQASAQVLGFVGRRLLAEPIALVFAARATVEPRELPRRITWRVCPNSGWAGWMKSRLVRCWRRLPQVRSTRASGPGSSRRHTAILSPCSSSTRAWVPPNSPAGSRFLMREICPGASRTST